MFTFLKKMMKKYYADDCVNDAFKSDDKITVHITKKSYVFEPKDSAKIGIIHYPGGRVQAKAFANSARYFSEHGYLVSLEIMPFGLAMMDIDRAIKSKEKHKDIETWILAGFSLGGVAATLHVKRYPQEYDGLILYGSYPSEKIDISDVDIKALQLLGDLDGFGLVDKAESARKYLPEDTQVYIMKGGNHVQFAEYNKAVAYEKDNKAAITRKEQQKILRRKTVEFIQNI